MKIGLLTDGIFPYVIGGMQKHSYYLAKYFAKNKVYVDVYYCQKNLNVSSPFSEEELRYITLVKLDFPNLDKLPGHYLRESYKHSCNLFNLIKYDLLDYDFIYAQGFTGWNLIEQKLNGIRCPPIGVNFHGLEMFQTAAGIKQKIEHLMFSKPVKYILKYADVVFCLGGKLVNIIKKYTKDSSKIISISIGIEEKWADIESIENVNNNKRNFVFIGRYERRKGIEELNKAISKINDKYNFSFDFIGHVPDDKKLKVSNAYYHGLILNEDYIINILSKADYLICPSYSEGMPTVILEAMASGCAIIATDVGAVTEQVNGNGWLLPYPNVKLIEETMIKAITIDNVSLLRMKRRSKALIKEKFLWDDVIEQTIQEIQKII